MAPSTSARHRAVGSADRKTNKRRKVRYAPNAASLRAPPSLLSLQQVEIGRFKPKRLPEEDGPTTFVRRSALRDQR